MCWIALPSGDGSHAMRILEGTITVGTTVTFNEIGSWILPALSAGNVSPSIRVESGTNLRIFYGGMDDARSLNELVGTCTYTGCSWSNTVIPGRSPFGTGMDPNLEIHMGYP
jgi:hypothetical protein